MESQLAAYQDNILNREIITCIVVYVTNQKKDHHRKISASLTSEKKKGEKKEH